MAEVTCYGVRTRFGGDKAINVCEVHRRLRDVNLVFGCSTAERSSARTPFVVALLFGRSYQIRHTPRPGDQIEGRSVFGGAVLLLAFLSYPLELTFLGRFWKCLNRDFEELEEKT